MSSQLYQRAPNKITVKSLYTNETKKIDNNAVPTFDKLHHTSVQNFRLFPKQNYSKVDTQIANINAHKGPDEVR